MEADTQIQALLRKLEAEEMELVRQRRALEQLVEGREAEFRKVERGISERIERLGELQGKGRQTAAREKNINRISTGLAFATRLKQEIQSREPELKEKKGDFERAAERLALLEAELKKLQLEKRKLEKLLDNRHQAGRVMEEAREEASMDEMSRMPRQRRERE